MKLSNFQRNPPSNRRRRPTSGNSWNAVCTASLIFALCIVSVQCLRRADVTEDVDEDVDFTCPEMFGYYPESSNCSIYYICDHGKATAKVCDDGLVFSTILKTCDWPYNVQCSHADGNRGSFAGGRHLRLRTDDNHRDGNQLESQDQTPGNRRQPVLSNDDDSYWLGRPDTTLLAALNDEDDYIESFHYEEPQRIQRTGSTTTTRAPVRQPTTRRQQNRQPVHNVERSNEENRSVNPNSGDSGPWFHKLNFDQIHHQDNRNNRNGNNQRNAHRLNDDKQETTTTVSPFISTNQRGGTGWRHRSRPQFSHATSPPPPTTTQSPQLLPRKALRIGNIDEDVLVTDLDSNSPRSGSDQNDYDLDQELNNLQKQNNADSYRLISRNQQQTTFRPDPTTTQAPSFASENLRPRHLGTAVRRRKNPKQSSRSQSIPTVFQPAITTPRPQLHTAAPNSWASSQALFQRNPSAETTVRRNIPNDPRFNNFERRPVLRSQEDPENENDDDLVGKDIDDYSNFYTDPIDIRKKTSESDDDEDHITPKVVAKEVPNSIQESPRRHRPVTRVQFSSPPPTTTIRPKQPTSRISTQNIYKAFDQGFNQAVKPTTATGNIRNQDEHEPFVHPSSDMEYEDIENDDDDDENASEEESVESDNRNANNGNNHRHANKEIVVRYDDEEEEPFQNGRFANATNSAVHPAPTTRPTLYTRTLTSAGPTLAPRPQTIYPTPPRLTQFVDLWVNRNPQQSSHSPAIHPSQLVNQHRANALNSNGHSYVNFGMIPSIQNGSSYAFLSPHTVPQNQRPARLFADDITALVNNSPKQPRSTTWVGSNTPKEPKIPKKQTQKVKPITTHKKQPKSQHSTNKAQKAKKFHKIPAQKMFRQQTYQKAKRCSPEVCRLPNCRCGGTDIPAGFSPKETPQIVLLTFDDSVNDLNRQIYKRLFEEGRKNPNGCPIRSTFYVSHEWTDYAQVQNLYSNGHEMASHSISHSFGEKFSKDKWLAEISGQREIMSLYGGVDWRDIRGMRAPFLQTGGNAMFEMLHEANFSYDSSMPVYDIDPPFWPYTFDYALSHDCMIEPCPTSSIPNLWEVGMVMWEDLRGGRCSMADGCFNPPDTDGVYDMVKANFLRHYKTNRSPFGMYFHSRWFLTEHNMNGFVKFLDEILQMKDVYLVTNWQMIQWMRHPTPLSHIKNFAPFGCDDIRERPPQCKQAHTCKVRFRNEIRTMRTCQECPKKYPWTGNNGFEE